ncbi:transmembrane and death domain protein 1-like [Anguilla anguilla]|uniref:transmembrane and death domain protein 1-like n=1 Tax=Anguilla anguilla TaxID=7936 RepID=UPI0015A7F2C7|nr:transmembrane and death domain protein 1-like [Anguilla anguilla]
MRTTGLFALLFLFLLPCLGEDTVAEDLGVHQLGRLVELLTPRECENLLSALSHPEDSVFRQLERLAPGSNDLGLPPRVRRDTEIGKNINQDKALSLQKYVEDYHRRVDTMGSPLVQPEMETIQLASQQAMRQVRDLTWRDLELVVERQQRPPYNRRLVDGVLPLVYGILLGFVGALLVGVLVLLFALHLSRADGVLRLSCRSRAKARRQRRPSPGRFSCDVTSSESDTLSSYAAPLHPRRPSGGICGFFPGRGFVQRFWGLVKQKPGLA